MMLGRLSVSVRFLVVLALGVTVQAIIACTSLLNLREELLADRASEEKHLVETAYNEVAYFHDLAAKGAMTDEAAREAAKNAVRAMRYDGTNYFFIWDLNGTAIEHVNRALEGKTYINTEDAAKSPFVADMVAKLVAVGRNGEGATSYRIPKAGQTEPMAKIAYAHQFAPWGWVIGSGAYVDDIDAAFWAQARKELIIALALVAVATILTFLLGRDLSHALRKLSQRVSAVAASELDGDIPAIERKDEVGSMARAVLVLRDNSREAVRLKNVQSMIESATQDEKRQAILDLAAEFEANVSALVTLVARSAHQVHGDADAMLKATQQTDDEAKIVAMASAQASATVKNVAEVVNAMSRTVDEISEKVGHSARVAGDAAERAQLANSKIQALEEAGQKIGAVVELISSVAGQTNLLALNATIEAARAGEAGKGFAVVAGEVKHLAGQTARATTEITSQVEQMQLATREAVAAIRSVAGSISEVDATAGAIAAAIASQSEATEQIVRNVARTDEDSQQVMISIDRVVRSTAEAGETAAGLLKASEDLGQKARDLHQQVDGFIRNLRG